MVADTKTTTLPHDPALAELNRMVAKLGTQKAVAEALEIHPSYLGEMLSGKNPISENVLKKIGYVRLTVNVKEDHAPLVVSAIDVTLQEISAVMEPRRTKVIKAIAGMQS